MKYGIRKIKRSRNFYFDKPRRESEEKKRQEKKQEECVEVRSEKPTLSSLKTLKSYTIE